MTSTPVASGTFTTSSTGQQQTLTLVQHQQQQQQQQPSGPTTVDAATATYVQTTRGTPTLVSAQRKQPSSEVLQSLLNSNRKINIVGASGSTTFRTNSAGNLIAVNLNQSQGQPQQQATDGSQAVRVSMSALASQLASPPAVMTNPPTGYGAYTVSTGGVCGSVKIHNTGQQQQQRILSSLRRDSTTAPPNAIVVGMAAPSPGSDSNASNASGFAVPTNLSSASGGGALNALLTNAATPSPSGSDHSQSSQTHQNQVLLDRLSNVTSNVSAVSAVAMPHMSPQQAASAQANQQQQQFITKTLVHSPATSSIHSPMSSPHPQPSASPQQQQQTTATLNLQGINLSQLQGAMANFAGLQNVQVQIPGFTQPISLQFSGNSLQAPVQVQQQQSQQQASTASGTLAPAQSQQRSVLVSVPVSTQQQQLSHTITLQTQTSPQQQQHQHQHAPPTGTIVSLPSAVAGTQTVVITNNATAGGGGTGGGGNASGTGATTAMLTLPIGK